MTLLLSYLPITDPTFIFFVVLMIILFAPIVMSKLRIPHIIGMVLAGIAIGQYGFNILVRDNSFELFGRVGLYYIMFLAGLEMDMEGVKKHSRRFLLFGLLTCFVPLILTYAMSVTILDYSSSASFLLGCIMASNTLIAYPIVGRYGLQKHQSVALSVGSSMISLFMALVMLAAISGSFSKDSGWWFWVLFVVKFAAFCVGSVVLIPKLTRYFLRRYSDAVMQYTFVMAVMFLSAALSSLIGIEGVFGAFYSGLILNRYIPRVSPLMNRIEFIGNALFIPYFLIGVGMLINLGTLFSSMQMVWIVLLIVFFGTFGKAVAAYICSLLFRLSKADGHMMFGLTSAHAAGAIAMVMVGIRLEVAPGEYLVSDDMLNGIIMMILFTCIISTMMTEHAAKKIIIQEKTHLQGDVPKDDDEKILLCVKYPEIAPHLLYMSMFMRNQRLNRDLVALNVVYDDERSNAAREEGIRLLEQLQHTASASEVKVQTQVRLATNIANGIKHAFREFGCSEIVMGMHVHTDINPRFWGEFIQSLYNGLNRQILLVRFVQPMTTLRRIRVAVPSRAEFEPGFHRWLERLSRLAGQLDCRIQFHGRNESLMLIKEYINNRHPNVRAEYTYMAHWNELPQLAAGIADDHLFVVVTARKGTISYKTALERLPDELQKHFSGKNLMIIFPDQHGDTKDERMSFTEAQHHEEKSIYDTILRWIHERKIKH
ncbi:MAG: cation:proton antiporter [Prevotella sp.]|uniref:Cation transporter, monovalent cation:proton antiporter-2 (CPA2) family n=2 Tax=Xylanibacter ruminicola TaxID=839 RepID=D5EVC0_XYLR2|nr:cation:proton antiporter [Xylanibacter ruminicola]ADE82932.1 cation transporter, monovalent cation:proton antiporter-2 (CPA2) family [Xylanibacter ruminicola 23]MBO4895430.1 cation:proton antiporter [Prevotella sp.]MBQ6918582.1 cation:proton antiporter [Prevotella sp.]